MSYGSHCNLSIHDGSPKYDSTAYQQLIGSHLYLVNTRPNLAYVMSFVSQFSNQDQHSHWQATQRDLHYIHGTLAFGINYIGGDVVASYSDSDWEGCIDTRHSTAGYCFTLGSGPISWKSQKQRITSSSSTEAEYKAYLDATSEALWIQQILAHRGCSTSTSTLIYSDSQRVIA